MSKCRFCEIIEDKDETEEIIYEDKEFIVITDKYRKTSAGAICLIIPKHHAQNVLELNDQSGHRLINLIKLISKAMQTAYNCNGIRIWTAVNKEAGQSIFHCHIHVVPCKSIKDRLIVLFPGSYDLFRKLVSFGKADLGDKLNYQLAEKIRIAIRANR